MAIFPQLFLSQGYLFPSLICIAHSFINLKNLLYISLIDSHAHLDNIHFYSKKGSGSLNLFFLLVPSLSSSVLMSKLFSPDDTWVFCKMVSFVHYFTVSKNHVVNQEQKNGEKIYNDHFHVLLYNSLITVSYRCISSC